jgi:exopolyphosphatase/guanosine-5'-triphosphate,3'-diphosphate pyrophosphatase
MEWANSRYAFVPEVGLKDGIMLHVYERNKLQQKIPFATLK